MTTGPRVELRIRRLVWEAANPPARAGLRAAVEAELAVLLGGCPTVDRAVPADPAVAAHARRIARAVHEALRAGPPPSPGAAPAQAGAPAP
ncbi:hypothetical protein ACH4E8_20075 [Streptomyces sp. NPDC017979]|uniref:hypothetical protein n=1 Tax=Streptomyces sp. NPDC017979 TaxID=3365024 RepID=UPI0037A3F001